MASGQRYPGRVVIVTGGTSGIGEGIVREFVHHGAKVVFCAPASEEEKGKGLERELAEGGGSGEGCFVVCDVLCETDMKNFGDNILLNNSYGGIDPPDQRIDDVSAQEFRNLMDLNIVSCFLMAKFALPYLRKTKGNIINVASIVAHFGQKLAVPYVATKGAVIAMTKAMAIDESQYGVRVNSISPSNIWTPGWEKLASQAANAEAMIKEGKDAQASALWENGNLMGRMGTPAECAKAALYLASDATFCTGTNLFLGGGAELGYGRKSHQDPNSGFDS
ncbi:putative 17-beta-hydroxysteroid dehydrogenase 14-like protein [Naja naja]|nr:putative 17-beta-hydroxysteroid dehydrogenase 14-like protein [Naja naja]